MAPRDVARLVALGRVAAGASLVLAPGLVTRLWVGADRPDLRVIARGLGSRDLVCGLITLHTLDRAEVGPRWLRTCAALDAGDAVATLGARANLPVVGVATLSLTALGSAAAQTWAASGLAAGDAAAPASA